MALAPIALHSSEQLAPLLVSLFTLLLASVAVGLRIQAHRLTRAALKADDFVIFVALFFAWINFILVIIATSYGGIGTHLSSLTDGNLRVLLKTRIAIFVLWQSTLSLVRISLLALYIRIFDHKTKPSASLQKNRSWFHFAAYAGIVVSGAFLVVVFLEEMLLCRPLAVNWNLSIKDYTCGNGDAAYVGTGVVNLLLDVFVIALPIPRIWSLQLSRRNKVVLSFLFSFGLIICIITIARVASKSTFYWTAEDPSFTIWKIIMWSQLEPNVAIVCACVPLMRPIFGTFFASHFSRHSRSKSGSDSEKKNAIRMDTHTDVESEKKAPRKGISSMGKYGRSAYDAEPETHLITDVMGGQPRANAPRGQSRPIVMGAPPRMPQGGERGEQQPFGGARGFQVRHYDLEAFAGQKQPRPVPRY